MDLGTSWLQASDALALILPSCIIPYENNAILNPLNPFNRLYPPFSATLLYSIPGWRKNHPETDAVVISQSQEPSLSRLARKSPVKDPPVSEPILI